MKYVNEDECESAGLDPKKVEEISRRLAKAMSDADALGLSAFGGSCSLNLRFRHNSEDRSLIVADGLGDNCDGGDGGSHEDENGLLRGE